MKTLKLLLILALVPVYHFSCSKKTADISLVALKCEYLTNPLGIDVMTPRLSWKAMAASGDVFNQRQQAYQILVASSPEN
jgi:alpha-L-rhamnosidase